MSLVDPAFESKVITLLKGIYDNIGGGGVGYTSIIMRVSQPIEGNPAVTITEIYNDSPYTLEVSSSQLGVAYLSSNYTGAPEYVTIFIQQSDPSNFFFAAIEDAGPPCLFFVASKSLATLEPAQAGLLNGVNFELRFYPEP